MGAVQETCDETSYLLAWSEERLLGLLKNDRWLRQ